MAIKYNENRGPWCKVCGAEMNRTNHRFEVSLSKVGTVFPSLVVSTFTGKSQVSAGGWDPICGEACLHKELTRWAHGAYPKEKTDGGSQGSQVPL